MKDIDVSQMSESTYGTDRGGAASFIPLAQLDSDGVIVAFQAYGWQPGELDIHVSLYLGQQNTLFSLLLFFITSILHSCTFTLSLFSFSLFCYSISPTHSPPFNSPLLPHSLSYPQLPSMHLSIVSDNALRKSPQNTYQMVE